MKANVFERELEDGTVLVECPEHGVTGTGPTLRMACTAFVNAWHEKYLLPPTLEAANEKETNDGDQAGQDRQ